MIFTISQEIENLDLEATIAKGDLEGYTYFADILTEAL